MRCHVLGSPEEFVGVWTRWLRPTCKRHSLRAMHGRPLHRLKGHAEFARRGPLVVLHKYPGTLERGRLEPAERATVHSPGPVHASGASMDAAPG